MLRDSNYAPPLDGGKSSAESSNTKRLHSTPARYPECYYPSVTPPSIASITRHLKDITLAPSPIKNSDNRLSQFQEASATSHSSSLSTASRMINNPNLHSTVRHHSTYGDFGTSGSVSTHPNHVSMPSLETNPLNQNLESNTPSYFEEPAYIYDCKMKKTYYKGKYLGKGGFARVYQLEDLTTGSTFAGKIIPKSRITKPRHKEKIIREIELHKRFVHENIVRFYDCFEDETNVYIILESCSRRSLSHLMKQRKTLNEPEVRMHLRQLIDGLRYLHELNIVHRDLKLGNMLLTEDMTIKICDFGLASPFDPDTKVSICGTPNYIAPEVLLRQAHGFEADVWAVGCIMYAMLVGQPPFETPSLEETYTKITENSYDIPRWISRAARSLIRQLLSPEPSQRPTLDEIMSHEFFTCGVAPPGRLSCSSNADVSNPNDSGFRSDFDSTNENASPMLNSLRPSSRVRSNTNPSESESSHKAGKRWQPIDQTHEDMPAIGTCESPSVAADSRAVKPKDRRPKITGSAYADCEETSRTSPISRIPASPASRHYPMNINLAPSLFVALESCLKLAPKSGTNPCPAPYQPLFISKWIDYSNRHGFGFQLSDGYVGILFNDCSRIGYSDGQSCIEYQDESGKVSTCNLDALPEHVTDKVRLLSYFVRYMEENMVDGGGSQASQSSCASPSLAHGATHHLSSGHLKRWVRTPEAIIMQLINGTLQINFLQDHTKIILSSSVGPNETTQYWATYINGARQSITFTLMDITADGCDGILRERLCYALTVLREFDDLDSDKTM